MDTPFKHENLKAIERVHPDIFKLIGKGCCKSTSLDLKIEKSRNSEITLSVLTKDKARIYLHSKYHPSKESEKIIDSWHIKKTDSNILILGFGLGYLPTALLEKLNSTQNLFIVEPSVDIFLQGVELINLIPILSRPNTIFFIGPDFLNKIKNHFLETDFKTVFFVHQPSLRLFPELEDAVSYLEGISLSKLKKELYYPKLKSKIPKVLLFETGFFIENEFKNNLVRLQIPHASLSADVNRKVGDADFIRRLMGILTEFKPDFIFNINQRGFDLEGKLVEMLTYYEIPFVCWHVDNPLPLLLRQNKNASEYGLYLLWDDYYVQQMKKLGFPNVEYLPYAADSTIFHPPSHPISKKYPVSFVGNSLDNIIRARLKEIRHESYLMEIYEKLSKNSPPLSTDHIETIDLIRKEIGTKKFADYELYSLEIAINSKWTQARRVRSLLAVEEFNPHIFGDEGWNKLLPSSFNFHQEVNYHKELPDIYRATEINLNITNIQLKNSVNQRLFDVCACSSFFLTDHGSAVRRFLVPGESVETFESHKELKKKVSFYLNHPEKREEIAKKGSKIILEQHSYARRFEEIFSMLKKIFA